MYDRTPDRVIEMVEDSLTRVLAYGETVDSLEFTFGVLPNGQGGAQMVGLLYLALKGPVLGTTIYAGQVIVNLGALASQAVIDEQVRICLEAIRTQKAQVLAAANGHNN